MQAMLFAGVGVQLQHAELADPVAGAGQVRLQVHACGVCRTDLHIVDGELGEPKLPLVLGHQIVGTVRELGPGRQPLRARVSVSAFRGSGGRAANVVYCRRGHENLCDRARFTGYTIDGGFAEQTVADERFCFPIPDGYPDLQAAPLLCAGLIGFRALLLTGDAERVGLYGFGAAAHIICQVARSQGRRVFAFTRPGDETTQAFARVARRRMGGRFVQRPPEPLDAAIIFAPAGELVPVALAATGKGGSVVCAGIHMSDIPSFPYELLWEERTIRSVANLTRKDGEAFMTLAPQVPVRTEVTAFSLDSAGEALATLRSGGVTGAVVLSIAPAS